MDSMRSLNRSLPRPSSNKPPEAILQSFKDAALSVTKLYKEAAASQQRARQAGYQDALDDLLALLDREDLGLGDGEGWRVRQWATERLDDEHRVGRSADEKNQDDRTTQEHQEDKEDSEDEGSTKRGDSPMETSAPATATATTQSTATQTITTAPTTTSAPSKPSTTAEEQSQPPQHIQPKQPSPAKKHSPSASDSQLLSKTTSSSHTSRISPVPRNEGFTFRAEPPSSMDVDAPVVRLSTNNPKRKRSQRNRGAGTADVALGPGSGAKRKFAMADFFDLAGLKDFEGFGKGSGNGGGGGREGGNGGGKRPKVG